MADSAPPLVTTPLAPADLVLAQKAIYKAAANARPDLSVELRDALTSKKFWALVTAVVTDFFAWHTGQIDPQAAVLALVGAVAAYCLGQGIADTKQP